MLSIKPHAAKVNNLIEKIEYTFIEIVLISGIFLLCYTPSQSKLSDPDVNSHGPHINLMTYDNQTLSDADQTDQTESVSVNEKTAPVIRDSEDSANIDNDTTLQGDADTEENTDEGLTPEVKSSKSTKNSTKRSSTSTKNGKPNVAPGTTTNTTDTAATVPATSTSTAPEATSTTDTASTTPTSAGTSTATINLNALGIAAGGGLVYFGQSDLDQYFQKLKDLGATWVRWDIDWGVVQPYNITDYQWEGIDRVANTAKKYGIHSLGIITYAPHWAQNKICTLDAHCPPTDPNMFARFAGVVATRYKGTVQDWEIWNEPNYAGFWSPAANAQDYVTLLKASYTEIKKSNPEATVITGGLAAINLDIESNLSIKTFIDTLYSSGARDYFDAIAIHPYTYPFAPSFIADWNSWQKISVVRQIMETNGDKDKKIWLTEYGAPTGGPGSLCSINKMDYTYETDFMSEIAQEQMAKEIVSSYDQNKAWLGPFFWYTLNDNGQGNATPENFFGLIRPDQSKKPAYAILKNAFN
jgi:hypothetical protein